ncbi:hypothetical protein I6F18_34610 [Bradyrhizobium sp. NBAIM32]|uniref:hypothetical protein n=1 Tax=Bradyrhizobium sp. NBAIM32 TaxID=2793809 RepID=UPI001CD701FA|nr:hypothetical protein [Bradyrhizobium sp. NBAIM32]MCA1545021.1 hypothetical protein [Bradyrhizobium sp. NBAIM32]
MARLPVLISRIAPFDGRSPDAIAHVARLVRESGYIATTKRGSGAAEMTTRDAANLLIALHGSDSPKRAPEAVERFRRLPFSMCTSETSFGENIRDAFSASTFGEALEKTIEVVPELVLELRTRLLDQYKRNADEYSAFTDWPPSLEEIDCDLLISLRERRQGLQMKLSENIVLSEIYTTDEETDERRTELAAIYDANLPQSKLTAVMSGNFFGSNDRSDRGWKDREAVSSFGLTTLMAVWFALNPAEQIGSITEASLEWMRTLPGFAPPLVFAR